MSKTLIETKRCSICGEVKGFEGFYTRKTGAGNIRPTSRCKDCYKTEEYKERHRVKNRKYYRKSRADLYREDPLRYLYNIAKKRAKLNGLEFDIEPEDITFYPNCPVTGVELDQFTNKTHSSMSLDRVDNSKGYTKGNVVVISRWANLKKSNMSVDDLENIIKYMKEHLDG